ncbi:thiamine pyrophosphate-dependent enzyme, partial [Streptomyces sp. NPDC004044]
EHSMFYGPGWSVATPTRHSEKPRPFRAGRSHEFLVPSMATGRQVIAFCGDGGLSMLLGDLMTLKTGNLPVKLVVFDNLRLGMVKLEQEQAGLPEFGTLLDNPDFAAVATAMGITGIRVTDPAELEESVRRAFNTPGPVLLDVLTNPDEIAIPAKPTVGQGWRFAVAKVKEVVRGHREPDSH